MTSRPWKRLVTERANGERIQLCGGGRQDSARLRHSLMAKKTKPVRDGRREMDWLQDDRTDCLSALVKMQTGNYLALVKDAHEQRGAISGQRDVLKTTTAKRIRDRMISDIRAGAVLPPVVIGVVLDKAKDEGFATNEGDGRRDVPWAHLQKRALHNRRHAAHSVPDGGSRCRLRRVRSRDESRVLGWPTPLVPSCTGCSF